jgi:hypothetical protein
MRPKPAKVLIVATRTAACPELVDVLTRRAAESPASFTLLVPATPHGWAWLADMYSGGIDAQRYLDAAVERYREAGLDLATARLGDPDPLAAVMDAMHFDSFDEVVVSTMPRHLSRWLRISLPHRVGAATGLPVTHVLGSQTRLAERGDSRRGRHRPGSHSVYLDGHGAARVLGVDDAAPSTRGLEQ